MLSVANIDSHQNCCGWMNDRQIGRNNLGETSLEKVKEKYECREK